MSTHWTIIGVRDVPFSFNWYRRVLRRDTQSSSRPRLLGTGSCDSDGTVLFCYMRGGSTA